MLDASETNKGLNITMNLDEAASEVQRFRVLSSLLVSRFFLMKLLRHSLSCDGSEPSVGGEESTDTTVTPSLPL